MKVLRIVTNVGATTPAAAKRFYRDVLGLDVLMDMGWIETYGSSETMTVQISFMSQGAQAHPCQTCPSRSTTSMRPSLG